LSQPLARFATPRSSIGLKLLLVCGLAVLMSIPAVFVAMLLGDRTQRANEVAGEIAQLVGGPQTFLGPVVAVPYTLPPADPKAAPGVGTYVIYPVQGSARADVASEVRRRSLFKVPVYQTTLSFKADFDLTGATVAAPRDAVLDWARAEVVVGASDPRGAQADVTINLAGRPLAAAPATTLSEQGLANADDGRPAGGKLRFFGVPAVGAAAPAAKMHVDAMMKFSGAQRLSVLAYAKTTTFEAKGDWPHPSFDGGFLPTRRATHPTGFEAGWSVPFIARGVPAQGTVETLTQLGQTALGVSFVEPANPYHSVARSLKYALMFVGLVFLAYFMFETQQGKRVHPAQYVLIGLAQIVFYLLLLSVAERVGFDLGFLIAAGATVGLISSYAGWVFESRKQGLVALAGFSLLYGLIYVLMRLEDLALLVGAIASFAAIAAVMYVTRRMDWYGVTAPPAGGRAPVKDLSNG
jgi:inner membrane protein